MTTGVEREIKLAASGDFVLPGLVGILPGSTENRRPPRRLRASYWDTPDLRLSRSGLSVRRRAGDAEVARWTVKLPQPSGQGVLSRREVHFEGSGAAVPAAAARLVRAYVRDAPLRQIVELQSLRTSVELVDRAGRRLAEVDDDVVSVVEGPSVLPRFREVEVELADGAPPTVARAVAARLRRAGALDGTPLPKVARALGAGGAGEVFVEQVKARDPGGELLRAALADSVSRLFRHDPGVRLGEDPEEVHRARVATRRLRSDLRSMRGLVDPAWGRSLDSDAGWVAGLLGEVRDTDVLIQRLWSDTARLGAADVEAASALLGALAETRTAHLESLWAAMDSQRYLELLERLVEATRRLPPGGRTPRSARSEAARAVSAAWGRLAREVERAGEDAAEPALHRVRIKAKRCRYAADVAALVAGKPARRLSRSLARVQDCLGDIHDSAVAEAWLRGEGRARAPGAALVAGELIAAERSRSRRARQQWPRLWAKASRESLRRWAS